MRYLFVARTLLSRNNTIIKKSVQAASEIKPELQSAYDNKFNYESEASSVENNTANNLKMKLSTPRVLSNGWKKFAQHLEMPKKVLPENLFLSKQKKFSSVKITSPRFFPKSDKIEDTNLTPNVDVVKITTIIETFRKRGQQNASKGVSEEPENTERIGKKRSKRSSLKSENNTTATESSLRYSRENIVNRDQGEKIFSREKRGATYDVVVRGNGAIPSNVFYKRIWEYINGTRPHSDIISRYNTSENNSDEDDPTCIERIAASSQEGDFRVVNPEVQPEQEFYKRIWDIINATRSIYENSRSRSKRNANIPKTNISTSRSCARGRRADYREGKRAINEKAPLDITHTTNSNRKTYDRGFYRDASNSWIANKTQWRSEPVSPLAHVIKSSNDPSISSSRITDASEVADLNKSLDEAQNRTDFSTSGNSTRCVDEARGNKSLEIVEPGFSPYSQQKKSFTVSSNGRQAVSNISQKDSQKRDNEYQSTDNPFYELFRIPYVEVPDYSDQREDSLDKSDQRSVTDKYKEYDDGDYVDPEKLYNSDDFSSKYPSAEIKLAPNIRTGDDEHESSANANISRLEIGGSKDSAEYKHNIEDIKFLGDTSGDIHRSTKNSTAESAEAVDSADFAPIHFDINEYRRPFDFDYFLKNDPIFKSARAPASTEDTKDSDKENSDDESAEYETYTRYTKEQPRDYFRRNENLYDDFGAAYDRDAKENPDSYEKEEAKSDEATDGDYYSDSDKDFLKHIFGDDKDRSKESSDKVDREDEFLSRYFTKDVLRHLRENSTTEKDRKQEGSRNREDVRKTLSGILDKKDRFSRLSEDLDTMIEKGEATPISYNNFWSLEYESPKRAKAKKEVEI